MISGLGPARACSSCADPARARPANWIMRPGPGPAAIFFLLTMFWQQSRYDSRLGFSFRVLVRVRVRVSDMVKVRVRVGCRVGVRIRVNLSLTLTKTLKLNPNLLSYWEC